MKRAAHPRERGIALLLVLWVFMVLGVLALDFSRYMHDDAMAALNFADETRGYYIALAGMNRAIYDAERIREQAAPVAGGTTATTIPVDPDDDDQPLVPPDGQWHDGEFAGGHWRVKMTDEGGRIALNKVDEVLLTRIVSNLVQGGNPVQGVDRRASNQIATVVDSILDWRDKDHLTRAHGAENDYYLKRRGGYPCKDGNFDAPEELLLVRGVTQQLYYGTDQVPGLKDIFSVYSRSGRINVENAPPEVLRAILGNDAAANLLEQRDNGASIVDLVKAQLVGIDPALAQLVEVQPPRVVHIEAMADTSATRNQSHVAAIADLSAEASEGTRIMRWLDRAPWEGALPGSAAGDHRAEAE